MIQQKTKTSVRDVPLMADTMNYLENQKNYWSFKVEKIDRYLFCTVDGNPISVQMLQTEIDNVVGKIHEAGQDFPRITSHGRVIIRTS